MSVLLTSYQLASNAMYVITLLMTLCWLQVTTNGLFSFGRSVSHSLPNLFPGTGSSNFLVAPFWANNDLSNRIGHVSYEVHTSSSSSQLLDLVNTFISQQQQSNFSATWLLVSEWMNVHQSDRPTDIVSPLEHYLKSRYLRYLNWSEFLNLHKISLSIVMWDWFLANFLWI